MTTSHNFFAHVAFAFDARSHATPLATANLLIEVEERAVKAHDRHRHVKVSERSDVHAAEVAGEIAMAAALSFLKAEPEFRTFTAQRFVNFDLIRPTHISVRPPPTKVLPDGSKIWRLAESEADKLRGEPHSTRYPDIEKRLATHPFLKGMSPHHLELLALCAMPTEFDAGQIVLRAGEPASGFYLIETGTVVLEGKAEDGETVVIDRITAGEPLGWSWLFPPYLWSHDARATEPCTALCFSGLLLRQHRDDDLTLSHELHKRASEVMARRLQAARSKLIARK
ncbi:MAG TPA: cyclic nucleotide-binding domain-containing protein [Chthoniobacterales bacterium]|nr:cyclic nucleotide-binding domain-containing protein [Chthoniobacterales bacterium]